MVMANVAFFFKWVRALTSPGQKERITVVAAVKLYFPVGSLKIYRGKFILR